MINNEAHREKREMVAFLTKSQPSSFQDTVCCLLTDLQQNKRGEGQTYIYLRQGFWKQQKKGWGGWFKSYTTNLRAE